MKKLYNGKEISKESILEMIRESSSENWRGSDLYGESEQIFEKMLEGYDGIDEDFEYIIIRLENDSNLQNVEDIIMSGEWNFGNWDDTGRKIW